ncbi:hypothetical protein VCSRO161_2721 [Vibrio cholerae]|nr:hypothetical protein VCSRO161_2721 [Vibrio cholerae]
MKDFTQWPVIGRGNERVCYQNPDDPSRCVKVSRKEKSKQSQREIRYFQYLVKRQVAFTHIPRFYSVIQTDRYLGLEQERVLDSQGKQPPDLYHYLCQPLSNKQQREFWLAMDMLKDYLIRYNIIQKWTPTVGHISSFLKWLTQLMLRIFAYRSRPHQE